MDYLDELLSASKELLDLDTKIPVHTTITLKEKEYVVSKHTALFNGEEIQEIFLPHPKFNEWNNRCDYEDIYQKFIWSRSPINSEMEILKKHFGESQFILFIGSWIENEPVVIQLRIINSQRIHLFIRPSFPC